ncbi:MAG: hypothetical protein KatS3mg104_2984 [Phycisphaerae bacterium]|nr:MAG: hypothetical protein KatS3mg104_2984 [Phycisphaerae bacterium]
MNGTTFNPDDVAVEISRHFSSYHTSPLVVYVGERDGCHEFSVRVKNHQIAEALNALEEYLSNPVPYRISVYTTV